ncbi:MAG: LysE family transporter [Candidatus Bathyarchaeia archaeon]
MELVTNFYLFLLSVIFISLSGVMMPGPVFAATVAEGYKNKIAGVKIALGHGIIEFPLIFLIYFGFTEFFSSNTIQKAISLVGGLILIYMGVQTFKTRNRVGGGNGFSKHGPIIAGALTTSANPYFFLWWATVGASLIISASAFGFPSVLIFAVTHWSCDLIWDTLVSVTVFKSRRFWTPRVHTIVFGFCFIVLVGFGAWFIASALS